MNNKLVKYLEIDDDVNVFVVGDIHASYSLLKEELKAIGFNYNTDLLIGVGDIVDRGGENEKCVSLLNEHWFTTVRGNHEQFCIDGAYDSSVAFYHRMSNNGGEWFYKQTEDVIGYIHNRFKQLPILLEVKYRGKKFGFVHADVPVEDWELLKEFVINSDEVNGRSVVDMCLWNRNIVNMDMVNIAQVDNVFLGHTVLPKIKQVGNCTFLDTGGCFKKYDDMYGLSIIKLSDYI